MSRLRNHLVARAAETEKAATKAQEDAAVAIAYDRPEAENQAIVDAAIAELIAQDDPATVLTARFVAALAALPAEARAQSINTLQSAINANRRLVARAGWSVLKKRIKDAAQKIDAALAGSRNADGLSSGLVVDHRDPLVLAKMIAGQFEVEGHCTLRRWKGQWYRWKQPIYEVLDDEIMDGLIYKFLAQLQISTSDGPKPLRPNKQLIQEVLHAFAPLVQVPGDSPTRWLDAEQRDRPPIDRCVFCSNGTVAVDAWIEGRDVAFIAPTPALFVLCAMEMPFNPQATAPQFEIFVSDVFDSDIDRIIALRLLFGYWLLADTSLQIVVVICGMPQSGKGTLLAIIQGVLGIACCNPSFEQLGGNFGLEDLVGANLGILSDVHDTGPNAKSAVEKILKISGEDPVDVPRKHKSALSGLRLKVRLVMAMNELISMPDISGALSRRMIVLPFKHSFIGQGEAGLAKKIIAKEGPGVLLWALEGLRLLLHVQKNAAANGLATKDTVIRLLRTKSGEADHEMLDDLSNPVRAFVREICVIKPGYVIEQDELYEFWSEWGLKNGHQKRSKNRFIADLLSASKGAVSKGALDNETAAGKYVLKGITSLKSRTYWAQMNANAVRMDAHH